MLLAQVTDTTLRFPNQVRHQVNQLRAQGLAYQLRLNHQIQLIRTLPNLNRVTIAIPIDQQTARLLSEQVIPYGPTNQRPQRDLIIAIGVLLTTTNRLLRDPAVRTVVPTVILRQVRIRLALERVEVIHRLERPQQPVEISGLVNEMPTRCSPIC